MSKVAKSKRKSRSKNGKIGKCAEGQDNEYTDSFPNYDSRPLRGFRRLSMFLYQGLHKEKETSLLSLCMAHFGSTATSLFEIYTPAWSSASTSRFHKGICFLSWQNFFLLSFFLFLLRSLFRSWFFHKQRASTSEFYKVHDVNRIWKLHENRALTWVVAATIDSPRIFSQVWKKGTFLIYQLLFENIFLELTRLLLKVSEYFLRKRYVECLNSV